MNQEMKTKWIAALESGEYDQGTQFLRRVENKFCCLGVLCDLDAKESGVDNWKIDKGGKGYRYKGTSIYLPQTLYDKYDIPTTETETLISLNDEENKSFIEIAAYIRNNI